MKSRTRSRKEKVEKLNKADSAAFQAEKQLKEYGDKISSGNKEAIEKAIADLRCR